MKVLIIKNKDEESVYYCCCLFVVFFHKIKKGKVSDIFDMILFDEKKRNMIRISKKGKLWIDTQLFQLNDENLFVEYQWSSFITTTITNCT
jgi:hypothetical protein